MKTRYVLRSILWGALGAASLWAFSGSTPWWVGAAFAAFFFGKAVLPLVQFVGTLSAKPAKLSFARGFRGMAIGYISAGALIGLGALWQRSFLGFLVAYGAFSFAWFWFWIARLVSKGDGKV